eukprot:1836965-Rhodomonas_salina.2
MTNAFQGNLQLMRADDTSCCLPPEPSHPHPRSPQHMLVLCPSLITCSGSQGGDDDEDEDDEDDEEGDVVMGQSPAKGSLSCRAANERVSSDGSRLPVTPHCSLLACLLRERARQRVCGR